MKFFRHQTGPESERGQQLSGPKRRGFLQQAGLAAIVVGGVETLGLPQAVAGTAPQRSAVPPSKDVGAVYPRPGKPTPGAMAKPDSSREVMWYRSPSHGEGCYFWYDSSNGEYGGPVCA